MPLNESDYNALKYFHGTLIGLPTILKDILPLLCYTVLTVDDIKRIEYRGEREGDSYGVIELIERYRARAASLTPFIDALKSIKGMEEIAEKFCEGAKSSSVAVASSNLSIKAQAARLFDDRQISQQIIESVDPVAVVLHLQGWCITADTAKSIADLPRPKAVLELKSAIKMCLNGVDEKVSDVIEKLNQIISAIESAQPSAQELVRLLREAAQKLGTE